MVVEPERKRFNIKHLIIIIVVLLIVLAVIISIRSFTFKKEYEPNTSVTGQLPRFKTFDMENIGVYTDKDRDGINDQHDILLGAKKQLSLGSTNIFAEGEEEPNYYSGGDPPLEYALSTDIIARAMAEAGYDLRMLVDEDISRDFDAYPLKALWNQSFTDPNIDYRRIQNLEVFLNRNAQRLGTKFDIKEKETSADWLPGDIVLFDMDRNGYTDTASIISDNTTREGVPKVIYNHTDPGFTTEDDLLVNKKITGHFRYP